MNALSLSDHSYFAEQLKLPEFRASEGWLECFKKRHSITLKSVCGESADTDMGAVDSWKAQLASLLKDYDPVDIFNADETGLFFE